MKDDDANNRTAGRTMKSIAWKLALVVLAMSLAAGLSAAAQQVNATKGLLVKNPPGKPASKTVVWKVSERASSTTVVGDPTVAGATLNIGLTSGGTLVTQCVQMPFIDWDAVSTLGFKYNDSSLDHGPVKVAQIKKTRSGGFQVKVIMKGSGITVVPGNPTSAYALNFKIGNGDEYCSGSGTATPKPNDAVTFKVRNDTAPTACLIPSC